MKIEFREFLKPGTGPLAAACVLLAATFAYPGLTLERDAYSYLFALDITQSMNTVDTKIGGNSASRLDFVKASLHKVVLNLPCGSRAGLAVFTAYRTFLLFSPVEVCANYTEIAAALDNASGRMAWAGDSEIAKGLYSGLGIVKNLGPENALVFITDGHEAPPLNPLHLPQFEGNAGEVKGMIVGVGGFSLQPIPKFDPEGNPLGYWKANDVLQTDSYSLGRGTSVEGEGMVEENGARVAKRKASGTEHLSSLKEDHLRELAQQTGLLYSRLESPDGLLRALSDGRLARPGPRPTDLRWLLGAAALLLLLSANIPPMRRAA